MKIKIIEPYDRDRRYDVRTLSPSLGPVFVATLLNENGHKIEVISEYITKLQQREIQEADLVGISITTYNAEKGYEIARKIKKPIVFGGIHASLMPEECLKYGDYVIRGDGHPILDLVSFLDNGSVGDIFKIPNLVFKKNGKIYYNKAESKPVNCIPDFSLVRDYNKLDIKRLFRIPLFVSASRGCPCNCSFCSVKAVYPDFRKRDVNVIIKDIQSQIRQQHPLARFLPKIIWITDDNFFSDRKWAKEVLSELEKLNSAYKFVIQARADIAEDDELLQLMKRAKISIVYMGIESFRDNSLLNFNKGLSIKYIVDAIKKIRSYGINVHGLFVFGDGDFIKGDGLRVAEFVKEHKLSGAIIQPLTPFPGTDLFNKLKEEGRILHEDWQYYNGKVVFIPKNMTANELQKEIYDCYRRVFSPLMVMKFMVRGPRGFRLAKLGEARLRHLEWIKKRNYVSDRLDG